MKAKHFVFAFIGVLISLLLVILFHLFSNRTEQVELPNKKTELPHGQIELPYRLADNLSRAEITLPAAREDRGHMELPFTFWCFPDCLEEWKLTNIAVASEKADSVTFVCKGKDAEIVSPQIQMPFSAVKEIRISVGVDKEHVSDKVSIFATFKEVPIPFKLRTITFAREGITEYKLNVRTNGENDPGTTKQFGGIDRIKLVFHSAEGTEVEIKHIKMFTRDHWYLVNRCGVSREVFENTWRDYIYSLCPSEIAFAVTLPRDCFLETTLGNIYPDKRILYQVLVREQGSAEDTVVASHSLRGNDPWKQVGCDLTKYAGKRIKLILKADVAGKNCAALWGNPAIYRNRDASSEGPNVILYVIDTLRADHLGCYGYDRPTSPCIDSLAANGVLFEGCIAQAPWTAPSAASYLSSLHATTHKVSVKQNPEGKLLDSMPIIPEILKNHGFTNAAFISNPMINSQRNLVRGYDSLYYINLLNGSSHVEPSSKILTEQVASWLENNHKKRFFLYIHTMDPHEPYDPSPPYDAMFQKEEAGEENTKHRKKAFEDFISAWRESGQHSFAEFKNNYPRNKLTQIAEQFRAEEALYDGEIRQNDDQLGKLMETLKGLGVEKDTVLIVMSDHGEEFFEKGFSGHGQSLHNFLIHVPLVFHYPPLIPQGKKISRPVQLIDVFPTLLDLLGIEKLRTLQGNSLVPLMRDRDSGKTLCHGYRGEFWQRTNFTDMIPEIYGEETHCLVDGKWKAVYRVLKGKPNKIELYDLDEDYGERNNLSTTEQALARKYKGIIIKWIAEQKAAFEKLHGDDHPREQTTVDLEELEKLKTLGYIR